MRVLLIKNNGWEDLRGKQSNTDDPVKGRIYDVEKLHFAHGMNWYKLKGFKDFYLANDFRPVEETWIGTLLRDIQRKAQREYSARTSGTKHTKFY